MKLFDLFDHPPYVWDSKGRASPCWTSSVEFWADMYAGKEKFVELIYASVAEYYNSAHHSEGGKPRIGFVDEYYPNPKWRDTYYSDIE